jgi:tetratricopeptide (TPR) repeat protein
MGELKVAERYLGRAIAVDPKQGAYYYQSGVVRQREKKWREALVLFERALDLGVGGDEAAVWRNIGNVRAKLFERDAALEAYETSLEIQPQDARTRLALGQFLLERDDPQRAVEQLRVAVEREPKLPGALASLGRAYGRLGDSPSSAAILRKAVELDPTDQESRYSLGQLLLMMGHEDEGRRELETYRQIADQVSQADRRFDAATALLAAGKPSEAQKLLEQVVALAPNYSPALGALGTVLLERGRPKEAVDVFRRAADLNPLSASIHFGFGTALFRTDKLAEALEETRRAIVLDDQNPQYRRQMGEIYLKSGRIAEGRDEMRVADELELR